MRSQYQGVVFDYGGEMFTMWAKHLRWKGKSFLRAVWYVRDPWTGDRIERLSRLWWLSVNGEPVFFDLAPNDREFSQALGEFLLKELGVRVEE